MLYNCMGIIKMMMLKRIIGPIQSNIYLLLSKTKNTNLIIFFKIENRLWINSNVNKFSS